MVHMLRLFFGGQRIPSTLTNNVAHLTKSRGAEGPGEQNLYFDFVIVTLLFMLNCLQCIILFSMAENQFSSSGYKLVSSRLQNYLNVAVLSALGKWG